MSDRHRTGIRPQSATRPASDVRDSITAWIQQLKAGDADAAQHLWEQYFLRMVRLARKKLSGSRKAVADEEDVALSAFRSFCLRAREGRFTQLTDRSNLWPLLMAMTQHKSVDLLRQQNRLRRGGTGGRQKADGSATPPPSAEAMSELLSREPNPEFAALMADELTLQLSRLDAAGDPNLRTIALLKLEGHSTTEIAEAVGCVRRSVERKLQLIAALWTSPAEDNDES